VSKTGLASTLGITRQALYFVSRKDHKDWTLKTRIEEVLRNHPTYGSRSIAIELTCNRKRIQRVMRKYGIRPYRRRGRMYRKTRKIRVIYPNLLKETVPSYPNHIWAADFSELRYYEKRVYVATVIDLYTRNIIGVAVSLRKGTPLTVQALYAALLHHPRPYIFHSDNGREYDAQVFTAALSGLGILVSRTQPGCPWENGYQESFYGKFKLELGDPERFHSFGTLVAEIYRVIWAYNNTRIHSALKMPPRQFAKQLAKSTLKVP